MAASANNQEHERGGIRFLALNVVTGVITIVLAIALLLSTHFISVESSALQQTNDRYVECELAVNELLETTTYLTTQSRLFSTTYHAAYLDNYYWELTHGQRRQAAVETLEKNYPDSDATEYLQSALEFSEKLSRNELYAMRLVVEALDLDIEDEVAAYLENVSFKRGDELLSSAEKLEKAHMLVTYEPYEHDVDRVAQQVEHCKHELANSLELEKQQHEKALSGLFMLQQVLVVALLALVVITATLSILMMFRPLAEYIRRIDRGERLDEKGAYELRYLAHSYNIMHEDNRRVRERLTFEAEHDALTGLFNRGACERMLIKHRESPLAMVIIDVDHFKEVNDVYGHGTGDRVLQEIANALKDAFVPEDAPFRLDEISFEDGGMPFRLGGDEFVVLLLGTADDLHELIEQRVCDAATRLIQPHDELPSICISAGVAFSDGSYQSGELYKHADKALYRVKSEGRHGLAFDGEDAIISFED